MCHSTPCSRMTQIRFIDRKKQTNHSNHCADGNVHGVCAFDAHHRHLTLENETTVHLSLDHSCTYHHLILGRWWWPLTHGHMALHEKYTTWRIALTWWPSMETRALVLRRTRSSIGVRQSTRVHLCMKTTTNRGISHLVSSEVGSFDGMRLSRRRIRNRNAIVEGGVVVMVALPTATQGEDRHLKQKVRRHSLHWFQRDQNELDPQRFNEEDIENDVMSTWMMFYPCRYH